MPHPPVTKSQLAVARRVDANSIMKKNPSLIQIKEGRARAVIEGVYPEIDGGRYPIKRTIDEKVVVEADIFGDGHDSLSAMVKYRPAAATYWSEVAMESLVNDRWRASFRVTELGQYFYTLEAWTDHFKSWQKDFKKKVDAGQDVTVDLLAGVQFIQEAIQRAPESDKPELERWVRELSSGDIATLEQRIQHALEPQLAALMDRFPDRRFATRYVRKLVVTVDPVLARYGAWYEIFPRSASPDPSRSGTFKDCEALLPRIAEMGFDVLYLPPIHPIGRAFRKGKNNNPVCQPGEPGSPWGIGSEEGGHKAVHPELGTLEDFRQLVQKAKEHQLTVALDIAFQCSPDHPYVREHPEWFRKRPDGSIQYAENPPKKYQDIFPINFECENWQELWQELKSVFEFWIEQGVLVFRVDNPHTKALPFWEWAIGELKRDRPELIFLAEAFTRPKVMYNLAKIGYTQSYNYFPWRNTKWELTEYFTELTQTSVREFFRPNFWPNTPDILTQYLQYGGRPAFMVRFILAATLGASYGIYGPAFELCENSRAKEHGSEEYLNSEKYEIRHWDRNAPHSLHELIAKVNRIRRERSGLAQQ